MRIVAKRSSGVVFDPMAIAQAAANHQGPGDNGPVDADCNNVESDGNHHWRDALAIDPNSTIEGEVCPGRDNYYLVDLQTRWRLKLIFQKRDADLDLFLLDPNTGQLLTKPNGTPRAGLSRTSNERIRYTAPAIARIRQSGTGYGAYELSLKARRQRR